MKSIRIDGKEFKVPNECYHVAVDFDGKVYAYEKSPICGNNITGCWVTGCHWETPGVLIGDLDRIVPDWKTQVFAFMQMEHSCNCL